MPVRLAIAMLLVGCSGTEIEVGSNVRDAAGATSPCMMGSQMPIVGRWEGYVENQRYVSGSDALLLVISGANESALCGSVTFGMGTPPAPATDPDAAYPPAQFPYNILAVGKEPGRYEGFPFTLVDGKVTLPVVQFRMTVNEIWKGWCELQTPYPWEDAGSPDAFSCMPNEEVQFTEGQGCWFRLPDGGQLPIACGKTALCGGQKSCSCTAAGCKGRTIQAELEHGDLQFDLNLDGNALDGNYAGGAGRGNVRFTRAP